MDGLGHCRASHLVEAVLGALLVKLGYTAQSQSPMRPPFLALHLTTTLLLLAAITLTAHLLSRTTGYLRGSVRLVAPFGAVAAVIVVMIVGVTGSLAALGDTLFPASSLSRALAQDFSARKRMAGALALDASHRRSARQHFSGLDSAARAPDRMRTGIIADSSRLCWCCSA
jgi:heme A synthase